MASKRKASEAEPAFSRSVRDLSWRHPSATFALLLETFSVVSFGGVNLSREEARRRIDGLRLTADFFQALGVRPALGRGFLPEDDDPGAPPVVVLSYPVWQQYFGRDLDLVGEQIAMNDIHSTVVDVLPAGFVYADLSTAIYQPLHVASDPLYRGTNYTIVARLGDDISIERARADMTRLFSLYKESRPGLPSNLRRFGLGPCVRVGSGLKQSSDHGGISVVVLQTRWKEDDLRRL